MRYFLELAYNGASFHGWQVQPNASSVQATLEEALSKILRKETPVTGAGRTDTGVHARQMYAHFDTDHPIENKSEFLQSLNSLSGRNIAIKNILNVTNTAHARFDATERTYKYFVSYRKNPFLKDFFWKSPKELQIKDMNEAANLLITNSDFTSFAKLHSDAKTNICDVKLAEWRYLDQDKEAKEFLGTLDNGIVFTITADRFLRNMVRAIVGTLVEVGTGKLTKEGFKEIIDGRNRSIAGTSMPGNALFLWNIKYPFI